MIDGKAHFTARCYQIDLSIRSVRHTMVIGNVLQK